MENIFNNNKNKNKNNNNNNNNNNIYSLLTCIPVCSKYLSIWPKEQQQQQQQQQQHLYKCSIGHFGQKGETQL